MIHSPPPIGTTFASVGHLQRQIRQLLNAWPLPHDANERPVAFCRANAHIGVLPNELDAVAQRTLKRTATATRC
jgi:hypothetical protein